jgi:proteasome lid subunit RPN8/RPN11
MTASSIPGAGKAIGCLPEGLAALYLHATESYPEECCGFVFADGGLRRGRNIQGALHAADPIAFPRDARRGYSFAVEDMFAIEQSLETANPVVVIYHSHPDTEPYFSDEDSGRAVVGGRPVYPVAHLVVAVQQGRATEARLFCFDDRAYVLAAAFDEHGRHRPEP